MTAPQQLIERHDARPVRISTDRTFVWSLGTRDSVSLGNVYDLGRTFEEYLHFGGDPELYPSVIITRMHLDWCPVEVDLRHNWTSGVWTFIDAMFTFTSRHGGGTHYARLELRIPSARPSRRPSRPSRAVARNRA